MFNHKHYVPILKTKSGERWAIDHTTAERRPDITPLFEIHHHNSKDDSEHAREVCEDLASIWGTDSPLFLDTVLLQPPTGDPAVIQAAFVGARDSFLQAVPVVRLSFDDASLDVISDIVEQDGRGMMIRIQQTEVGLQPRIQEVLDHVGVTADDVHLLVDYKAIPMHLAHHIPQLPTLMAWRTLTAASAAFPRSLADVPENVWTDIERSDWLSWTNGIESGIERRPSFGDYILRDPGPPAGGGNPPVVLKYTKEIRWMVRKHGSLQGAHAGNMHHLCASLIAMPEFDGADFSDGDFQIEFTANPAHNTGGAQQWLQWALNHHIAFTVEQIRGLP